jgi:hypothetical protein
VLCTAYWQNKLTRIDNASNARAQEVSKGRTMYYGQTIQLRHLYTGKFMTVDQSKMSELDKSHLQVNIRGWGKLETACVFVDIG